VLLNREISIPSLKVLKSPALHRFAFTGWLIPGLTGSKPILARELLNGGTTPVLDVKRQSGIRSGERLGNCIGKEV
jgi:hypothetical protein